MNNPFEANLKFVKDLEKILKKHKKIMFFNSDGTCFLMTNEDYKMFEEIEFCYEGDKK